MRDPAVAGKRGRGLGGGQLQRRFRCAAPRRGMPGPDGTGATANGQAAVGATDRHEPDRRVLDHHRLDEADVRQPIGGGRGDRQQQGYHHRTRHNHPPLHTMVTKPGLSGEVQYAFKLPIRRGRIEQPAWKRRARSQSTD